MAFYNMRCISQLRSVAARSEPNPQGQPPAPRALLIPTLIAQTRALRTSINEPSFLAGLLAVLLSANIFSVSFCFSSLADRAKNVCMA